MTHDEIHDAVVRCLCQIAPEADPSSLRSNVSLRDQLDIDSMDFLNFMIALHKEFQVEIPEALYPQLSTLDGCIEFLASAASEK